MHLSEASVLRDMLINAKMLGHKLRRRIILLHVGISQPHALRLLQHQLAHTHPVLLEVPPHGHKLIWGGLSI